MAKHVTIKGDKALEKKLADLDAKVQKKIARSALNKSMTVIQRGIKAAVPSHMKSIRQSIGKRNKKNRRKGVSEAKVGVNVAKKGEKQVPHAHLIAGGTKDRYTKAGKYTGKIIATPFVERGYKASESAAIEKLKQATLEGIEKEAKRG